MIPASARNSAAYTRPIRLGNFLASMTQPAALSHPALVSTGISLRRYRIWISTVDSSWSAGGRWQEPFRTDTRCSGTRPSKAGSEIEESATSESCEWIRGGFVALPAGSRFSGCKQVLLWFPSVFPRPCSGKPLLTLLGRGCGRLIHSSWLDSTVAMGDRPPIKATIGNS